MSGTGNSHSDRTNLRLCFKGKYHPVLEMDFYSLTILLNEPKVALAVSKME